MRQEHLTGSREVEKLADLFALDQDIFAVPADASTTVTMTMLGGKVVHGQLPGE